MRPHRPRDSGAAQAWPRSPAAWVDRAGAAASTSRLKLILPAVLGLLLAGGCASTEADLRRELAAERDEGLNIVSREEVARWPPASPQRAIFRGWRALQFHDAATALSLIDPQPSPSTRPETEETIVGFAAAAVATKPRIVKVTRDGRRARALIELVGKQRHGDQTVQRVRSRLEVQLVRVASDWRVRVAATRQLNRADSR
jgi:hypothetical protein